MTFWLAPEVDKPIATSPAQQRASICRENSSSNPKSLPIAVKADVSVSFDCSDRDTHHSSKHLCDL